MDNIHSTMEGARKSEWRPKKYKKAEWDVLGAQRPPKKKTFTPHNTQAPNRVDLNKINKRS